MFGHCNVSQRLLYVCLFVVSKMKCFDDGMEIGGWILIHSLYGDEYLCVLRSCLFQRERECV